MLTLAGLSRRAQADSEAAAHTLSSAPGQTITLRAPRPFDIEIAAQGLRRVRFFAQSPDGRIFVTGLHSLTDNTNGSVFILDGFGSGKQKSGSVVHYLDHLRNPNSIAFSTEPGTSKTWLYVALTDKLVRYAYHSGDNHPSGAPEVLMRFPGYGLSYKYGGWHLTRTITIDSASAKPTIYLSVGSSCNYCVEREAVRATILSMDLDGKNPKIIARGVRNAVDLRYRPEIDGGTLFATNMGDDHLGDQLPDDTFLRIDAGAAAPVTFGWPACYFAQGQAVHDSTPLPSLHELVKRNALSQDPPAKAAASVYGVQRGVAVAGTNLAAGGGHAPVADDILLGPPAAPLVACDSVQKPYTWFAAHSSPLGFEHFTQADPLLGDSFLVALHGAGHPAIGAGYRIVRFTSENRRPVDFITGFLTSKNGRPVVHGRPCGIFRIGPDTFLVSDDYLGVIYYIHPRT